MAENLLQTLPTDVSGVHITDAQLHDGLGAPVIRLIDAIAALAQKHELSIYLVGGVVRDLLLNRATLDLDFTVVTQRFGHDVVELAQTLADHYGGAIEKHAAFGTAKWVLAPETAARFGAEAAQFPDHVDLVSARKETYSHPAALPVVQPGTLRDDLFRRDFTLNTLAVQFSPAEKRGIFIDPFGGLSDLQHGILRVLHPASFTDDPTRLFRAARFLTRFNLMLAPETETTISAALPALAQTTGERLRNELALLLDDDDPVRSLNWLVSHRLLAIVAPGLEGFSERLGHDFRLAQALFGKTNGRASLSLKDVPQGVQALTILVNQTTVAQVLWHILVAHLSASTARHLCERLLIGGKWAESLLLVNAMFREDWTDWKLSHVVERLDALPDHDDLLSAALLSLWVLKQPLFVPVAEYAGPWRRFRPYTDGAALKARGLSPGPCYKIILTRLRRAWIDGDVSDAAEEADLLDQLIAANICAGQASES